MNLTFKVKEIENQISKLKEEKIDLIANYEK